MAKFVDLDKDTGVETLMDYDEGKVQYHYRQDVSSLLDYTQRARNDGLTDHGIKNDLWHYAQIPPVIILELKFKFGCDIFKREHMKRAFYLINTEYPYLKMTNKTHTLHH